MGDHQTKFRVRIAAVAGLAALAAAAAGCSSSASSNGGTSAGATAKASAKSPASAKPTGNVNVAYASSLQYLNEKVVSPAFTAAEGYKFVGHGGCIRRSRERTSRAVSSARTSSRASAGTTSPRSSRSSPAGTCSTPARRSCWPTTPRASTPADFKAIADGSKNVCTPVQQHAADARLQARPHRPERRPAGPGLHLHARAGPDPTATCPSDTVAKILGTSDFGTPSSPQIYAEAALDSTLQSGQLDASSAFITQAIELHLPVHQAAGPINLGSAGRSRGLQARPRSRSRTARPKKGSPAGHRHHHDRHKPSAAGIAFIKYTLSPAGLALYKHGGFTVLTPTVLRRQERGTRRDPE